jgi:hypothetical protein
MSHQKNEAAERNKAYNREGEQPSARYRRRAFDQPRNGDKDGAKGDQACRMR